QLRSTVSQFGVTSEPVRQMIEFLWGSQVLLPSDIQSIMRLILSQHQRLFTRNAGGLQPATTGSLGLDLATAIDVEILTAQPHKIPTTTKGPLTINQVAMGALIIGRCSASMMGLIVLPGLLDADYMGTIYIMAYTIVPPLRVNKGARITQLIPLPQYTQAIAPRSMQQRENKGFGSSGGLTLLTMDLSQCPKRKVVITYQNATCTLEVLLDTGADSSIVDPKFWLTDWPMLPSMTTVTGVGGLTLAKKS
ncbi:POK9 protein, partial [Pteruthius melanotis]|nr:POK9 protein [Pteruthius melanotis]